MLRKIIILTTCLLFGQNVANGKTELIVKFSKSHKILQTQGFRFFIFSENDTIRIFDTSVDNIKSRYNTTIPLGKKEIIGVFEFSFDMKSWKRVENVFSDKENPKRIEINLYYSTNDKKIEYLQDFTINKFYHTDKVVTQRLFEPKLDAQPVFLLINNSDTTFWGSSRTNHFYGIIESETDLSKAKFSGSFCGTTVPEEPLTKQHPVLSYIPGYNPSDEYKIKNRGKYKYVVTMGLDRFSDGIPIKFIEDAQTRKRTRIFYEIEAEFEIE